MSSNYAIFTGDWILVTGANGYIATHVVDILLQLGYNVRGTVRAKKEFLDRFFEDKYGKDRFRSVIVPAIEDNDAFNEALEGVTGVVHVASDTTLKPDPDVIIPKVVAGTLNLLKSAAKYPNIRRVVLTSSSTALLIPKINEKRQVDSNTWNFESIQAAWNNGVPPEQMPFTVYAASKTEAERWAWKWVKDNQPTFTFNVVLPSLNFGRILIPEIHGSTMRYACNLLHGDTYVMKILPPKWCVNVEDTARLHVIGLLSPDVKSERIFAFAKPHNWTDIINILRKLRPENKLIPDPPPNEGRDLTEVLPSQRAEQLLRDFFQRPGWTSLEDSLAAGIEGVN
ncbi:hypothetical protein F5884DRAFT_847965 [Xylogone sp. PMI_703]|nr:hypothetical protein F5884DRAFT_847965 [Xylogone sp. PMI_703]